MSSCTSLTYMQPLTTVSTRLSNPYLHGSATCSPDLEATSKSSNDWGLMQEVARYRKIDNNIVSLATRLEEYKPDIDAMQASLALCKSHLMLAQAGE
jgi:hypothetical protein